MSTSPIAICDDPEVHEGPALLAGVSDGPSLAAHRAAYGDPPGSSLDDLVARRRRRRLRGRGGAAFPFAIKLGPAAEPRRPVVVVNLSEGEPASSKDSALARTRPHLVLDGAVATAARSAPGRCTSSSPATGRSPRPPWRRRWPSAATSGCGWCGTSPHRGSWPARPAPCSS